VAATGAAFAQSSVTLFGNVDMGVRQTKTDGVSLTELTNNLISSSALGFRGVEDLGGGLKAGFHMEGDLAGDVGTSAGLQFLRRSTVSLMGGFGELRLGRDYTPTFWNHTVFDPFGTNGLGSSTNMYGGAFGNPLNFDGGTVARSNNTIGYFLPAIGGLYGQFQYGVKEVTTGNSDSDYIGVRVGYRAGALDIALATASEGTARAGSNPKRTNIGASFDLGFMKPMMNYTVSDGPAANDVSNLMVGLTAPVGPGLIRASYTMTDVDNVGDGKQFAIGYTYNLSKRTSINANFARITADTGVVVGPTGVVGAAGSFTKRTGYEVGVRHTF